MFWESTKNDGYDARKTFSFPMMSCHSTPGPMAKKFWKNTRRLSRPVDRNSLPARFLGCHRNGVVLKCEEHSQLPVLSVAKLCSRSIRFSCSFSDLFFEALNIRHSQLVFCQGPVKARSRLRDAKSNVLRGFVEIRRGNCQFFVDEPEHSLR